MAYQFFAKAHQSKQPPTSPPLSSPPSSSPSSNTRRAKSPISPPSLSAFQHSTTSHATIAAKLKPPAGSGDSTYQPVAYPHPVTSGYPTPHPHVTIDPVNTAHIPSLSRITGLLLPIRYPNSFYTATITDPVIASVSRVAIYHDHPVAAAPATSPATAASTGSDKVIGGIRCRLEPVPPMSAKRLPGKASRDPANLYIQTLHLLSPYRSYGIATSLLNSLLFSTPPPASSEEKTGLKSGYRVSSLVRHYNIRTVTAHVHEANDEGLKWYVSRGFMVEEGVVENYYRKLKPSGARIVKLTLEWDDDEDVEEGGDAKLDAPEQENLSGDEEEHFASAEEEDEDDDWEKVEADDEDEDDHGVRPFSDSKLLDADDAASRKRKADDEPQR
ncbi:hypothetical protein P170DRAFT_436811 [Aspergillus steynii IBT 23096]|uniref:GNAT family acetyltransferase n=1 Tax=Aspergillus steynii IBT 23096 TaxID=1392250 RepID=A0A2I2G8I0_9EURO|nr:uncharacterized protein P170DRAFT_436811 [Aspergillus steynii IBT 23096]PLB49186.1 hypothetical protein P170DRAFT_436811 [Aspergillus steynii IBT 23096]